MTDQGSKLVLLLTPIGRDFIKLETYTFFYFRRLAIYTCTPIEKMATACKEFGKRAQDHGMIADVYDESKQGKFWKLSSGQHELYLWDCVTVRIPRLSADAAEGLKLPIAWQKCDESESDTMYNYIALGLYSWTLPSQPEPEKARQRIICSLCLESQASTWCFFTWYWPLIQATSISSTAALQMEKRVVLFEEPLRLS